MTRESATTAAPLEWGVATHTLEGEAVSGDRYLVEPSPNGILVAVIDGLGHGEEAALAAHTAVAALTEQSHQGLAAQVQRCHERLRSTRGAVMSLASFHPLEPTMTWLGVGDVEGVLIRAASDASRHYLFTRAGIVGYPLPPLRAAQLEVHPGDILLLATDGIRSGFVNRLNLQEPPQDIANQILAQSGRSTDDALILVARYRGQLT